ncbi:MAG: fructosamine kinase family protein [Lachnospiraceae bacterium]|nr:fructosamine kinase family protein [Lachnospiraceae bacterium]
MRKRQYDSVMSAIQDVYGGQTGEVHMQRVYGGDINDAYQVKLSNGETVFLKTNTFGRLHFFETEIDGLLAMRATKQIGVPKPLGFGTDQDKGISFLMLEFIHGTSRRETYWEHFGHQLASMHKAECSQFVTGEDRDVKYGFLTDNYIGSNPQKNSLKSSWISFYRDCRLAPQMNMAEGYFDPKMRKQCRYLLDHLDAYLREPEDSSLLHGDLWSGNVICGNDGNAWILDPASYVGDFETDLAMTQLFGSFPASFYAAYHEINPIEKDFFERRDIYHLYHLLNHLNLFGRSYLGSVRDILNRYTTIK